MNGTIKRTMPDKGFGFVTGADGTDYFVHHSAMQGCRIEDLNTGDAVTFEPTQGPKGPRAEQVQRAA